MIDDSSSDIEIIDENGISYETKDDNPQLADAMAKVFRMSGKKLLSKAKLHNPSKNVNEVKKEADFEVEGQVIEEALENNNKEEEEEESDVKPDDKELVKCRLKRKEKLNRGRLKPSVTDKEKEKPLMKIATRGVIQLFNAVKQQQNKLNTKLQERGLIEVKKDKIIKSVDKNEFLKALAGANKSNGALSTEVKDEEEEKPDEVKEEDEVSNSDGETNSTWQVLRTDFMMGAKLTDWDKKEETLETEKPLKKKRRKEK